MKEMAADIQPEPEPEATPMRLSRVGSSTTPPPVDYLAGSPCVHPTHVHVHNPTDQCTAVYTAGWFLTLLRVWF